MYMAPRYSNRVVATRTAVFDIVLRDGVNALNYQAVATELGISLSTVRRWVPDADYLPRLGVAQVEYRRRCRLMQRAPGEVDATERWQRALNFLLRELPFDD